MQVLEVLEVQGECRYWMSKGTRGVQVLGECWYWGSAGTGGVQVPGGIGSTGGVQVLEE